MIKESLEVSGALHSQTGPFDILVVSNSENKELVRIKPDGTVVLSGNVNEAAKIFWEAVQLMGQGLVNDRIKELEAIVRELRGRRD